MSSDLVRSPDLQTDSDRSATRLELFFDLAFVLAVARTADEFAQTFTWHGAAVFAGLVTVLWWAWAGATLYANRFDTDDVVYRVTTLAGMFAVVVLAVTAPAAAGEEGARFALAYGALRVLLLAQYARAWVHVPQARASIRVYLAAHAAGATAWFASALVEAPGRYVLWAVGLAVELAAPLLSTRTRSEAPVHLEHLPERFGLFVILVLGESVAAVTTGLSHAHWDGAGVAAAALSFVVAAILWWSYFDLAGAAGKRRLQDEGERSRTVHDRYLFLHLPVALALVTVAVALEHAVTDITDTGTTAPATRVALAAGLAVYLAAAAGLEALTAESRTWLLWPGLGVPAVVVVAAVSAGPPMLALQVVVLVLGLAVGLRQRYTRDLATAEV